MGVGVWRLTAGAVWRLEVRQEKPKKGNSKAFYVVPVLNQIMHASRRCDERDSIHDLFDQAERLDAAEPIGRIHKKVWFVLEHQHN